ncbi:cytidine deaminase [Rothia sp. AR01]|uniref:Cytidine deaminase n=1 Tax=Rothia santali TaxID=2949643 RepID=A0A9X2HHS6_9MICC|nr:cytidine deaminase [Rothia santali]MCP3426812.1 cytidine deaminase [Rothia santali]
MRLTEDEMWQRLQAAAREALTRAYCPYSNYPVGAAGMTDEGRTVVGANVENAAYGVTLCAECSMVSELHRVGGGSLRAVVCVDRDGAVITPCGRCRQLLYEHRGPELEVLTREGALTIDEMLPLAFGPRDLGLDVGPDAD